VAIAIPLTYFSNHARANPNEKKPPFDPNGRPAAFHVSRESNWSQ
jgi:hypothetical protein